MATNEVYKEARQIPLTVGANIAARSPVCVGKIAGVALTATGASGTQVATVALEGVFKLLVHADSGSGTTIAQGDILYWTQGDTPQISVKTSGVRFGYALEAISVSGGEATIPVLLGT
jgi:predicted RecA/RadA family phage recombinase